MHAGLSALVQRDPLFGTFAAATIAALEVPRPKPSKPAGRPVADFLSKFHAGILLAHEKREKPMPMYTPVDRAAARLSVTVDKLRELESFGWISVVERNGVLYIPGHHEYKAKFILHLQQVRKLNSQQISRVLLAEEPPYSLADIDRILADEPGGQASAQEELAHESWRIRR